MTYARSGFADGRPVNPVVGFFRSAGNVKALSVGRESPAREKPRLVPLDFRVSDADSLSSPQGGEGWG